jgi:hypothetical protein
MLYVNAPKWWSLLLKRYTIRVELKIVKSASRHVMVLRLNFSHVSAPEYFMALHLIQRQKRSIFCIL